jgi:hypothetical protein
MMALCDETFKGMGGSWASSVLIGVSVALVAPVVVPALTAGLRPLAKTLLKGGIVVDDTATEILADMGEQMSDVVAAARAETTAAAAAATTATHNTTATSHGHTTRSHAVESL